MKREYRRSEPLFSQCGLNCGLCPMYHIREESHCPGCGGPGRPSCPILRCAGEHGGVEFCSLCPDWPCQRYVQEQADSFIPHRNARRDLETVKRVGLEHYRETLGKKMEGLRFLLERCNDGRRKSLFCTAVNLLELEDVEAVIARLEEEFGPEYPPEEQKDRGSRAAELFRERAQTRGGSLKLERQRKP